MIPPINDKILNKDENHQSIISFAFSSIPLLFYALFVYPFLSTFVVPFFPVCSFPPQVAISFPMLRISQQCSRWQEPLGTAYLNSPHVQPGLDLNHHHQQPFLSHPSTAPGKISTILPTAPWILVVTLTPCPIQSRTFPNELPFTTKVISRSCLDYVLCIALSFFPFLLEGEAACFHIPLHKLLFHSQSRRKLNLPIDLTSFIIRLLKATSIQFIHTNYNTIYSFIFLSLTKKTMLKNKILTIFRLLMSNASHQANQYFPSTLSHALLTIWVTLTWRMYSTQRSYWTMIGDFSLSTETPLGYIIIKDNYTVWRRIFNYLAVKHRKRNYTHYICANMHNKTIKVRLVPLFRFSNLKI